MKTHFPKNAGQKKPQLVSWSLISYSTASLSTFSSDFHRYMDNLPFFPECEGNTCHNTWKWVRSSIFLGCGLQGEISKMCMKRSPGKPQEPGSCCPLSLGLLCKALINFLPFPLPSTSTILHKPISQEWEWSSVVESSPNVREALCAIPRTQNKADPEGRAYSCWHGLSTAFYSGLPSASE